VVGAVIGRRICLIYLQSRQVLGVKDIMLICVSDANMSLKSEYPHNWLGICRHMSSNI
jgi:hypothetical protein